MISVATERRIVELLEASEVSGAFNVGPTIHAVKTIEIIAWLVGVHSETVLLRLWELRKKTGEFSPSIGSAAGEIKRNWTERIRQKRIVQGKTQLGIKVVKVPKELRAYAFCEGDLP